MPLEHTSHSAIEEYLTCPKRFKLNRIDKVPRTQLLAGPAGTAFHTMTEDFDNGQPVRKYQSYLDDVMEPDVPYITIRDENYSWWREHGEAMYGAYVKWRERTGWDVEAVELEFRVQPAGLQLPVVGFIDRVFRGRTGTTLVVDIKTGWRVRADSKQLPLYAGAYRVLAAEAGTAGDAGSSEGLRGEAEAVPPAMERVTGRLGEETPVATSYYTARTGNSTGLEWPDWDAGTLVGYVQPVEHEILNERFDAKPSAANCKFCPVREHCDERYVPRNVRKS